jgi:hypothetical protein
MTPVGAEVRAVMPDADAMTDVAMADMDAAAEVHAATEVDAAAAEAGHSDSAAAAAAEAAATEATGIGRVGRADEGRGTKRGNGRQSERCISDLAEHVSLLDRFGLVDQSFGYWSSAPVESVHRLVRILAFNFRWLAFIGRSSGG